MIVITFSDEKKCFHFEKWSLLPQKKYLKFWVFTESFFHSWFWRNFSTLTKTGNHYGWSLRVIITGNHYLQRVSLLTFYNPQPKKVLKPLWRLHFKLHVKRKISATFKNWAENAICRFFAVRLESWNLLTERIVPHLKNWAESAFCRFWLKCCEEDAKWRVYFLSEGDHCWKNTM